MRLFRGCTDAYPMRWESKKTGKSGYSPVCLNEWRAGVCDKLRVKCADCSSRLLRLLSEVIGDVFDKDEAEHNMLVFRHIHVVAQLVSGGSELGLKADVGGGVAAFSIRLP